MDKAGDPGGSEETDESSENRGCRWDGFVGSAADDDGGVSVGEDRRAIAWPGNTTNLC